MQDESPTLFYSPSVFRCGEHTVELEPTNGGFGQPVFWLVTDSHPFARIRRVQLKHYNNGVWGVDA